MGSSIDALEFEVGTRVHFVGIGGVSMSALAELMHHRGHTVTGSDKQASELTDRLGAMGLGIHIGHTAEAVEDTDMVVYTSAASDENPEILRAREDHIPLMKRSEFLGRLTAGKRLVGVAGTHGKTTTTAMVGAVLEAADLDPTVLVGGLVMGNEQNLRLGSQFVWAVEADEFDRSFLTLHPEVSVVTNLEADHLDCYRDLQEIQSAFDQYVNQTSCSAVLCVDSPLVSELQVKKPSRKIEYGIGFRAQLRADEIESKNFTSTIRIRFQNEELGNLFLQVPGLHNVRNALAAVGVGISLDLDWEAIRAGLESFRGVRRRFEILGEVDGVKVVSDYAHHPTEIRAVLEAARAEWSGRLVAVFQPHLYTRTRDFAKAFGMALSTADSVWVTDIYAAREEPIDKVDGGLVTDWVRKSGNGQVNLVPDANALPDKLLNELESEDLLIVMGAGDIDRVAHELVSRMRTR
ncbi:MAG TPA: UDP-N-acetylmuramate--L-alanine ligase [Candidatus Latescibacteria bacterium]|nr:UDP-N-acetylmuramate--L-alanine ligase [Candidatus Latescibacterota bacterium]|tara:strand:- start:366 stop:1757 length:1392 start_codon:yes stop_codon:yes gene_type:complete